MAKMYVSLKEAGEMLGVSSATVRRWVDNGTLGSIRSFGGHRKVSYDDVRAEMLRSRKRKVANSAVGDSSEEKGDQGHPLMKYANKTPGSVLDMIRIDQYNKWKEAEDAKEEKAEADPLGIANL